MQLENISNIKITEKGGHIKSRTGQPEGYPKRFLVPDDKVDWNTDFPEYKPEKFTHPSVLKRDKEKYQKIDTEKLPQNPQGRTGIEGRGLLYNWGTNFAADPIVTKTINGKTYLWAIKRQNGEWAIPGGMVEDGDTVTKTLEKELEEETGMKLMFDNVKILYKGYVDDPRNTDNSWIETVVAHINLSEDSKVKIGIGKDEKKETLEKEWKELTLEFIKSLYASHGNFVELALENLKEKK